MNVLDMTPAMRRASNILEESFASMKLEARKQAERLRALVGKEIASAKFEDENEGAYILVFTDGTKVCFSATGDDATYVTMTDD